MFVLNATLPKSLSLKFGVAINQDLRCILYAPSLFWEKVPILTRLTHTDQTLGVRAAYIKLKTAIIKCPYQLIFQSCYLPARYLPGRVVQLLGFFCDPLLYFHCTLTDFSNLFLVNKLQKRKKWQRKEIKFCVPMSQLWI